MQTNRYKLRKKKPKRELFTRIKLKNTIYLLHKTDFDTITYIMNRIEKK
jgi:hypothetical protein